MIEDQAKTKWCPMAKAPNDYRGNGDWETVVANRLPNGDADSGCLCLGSGCMAWRWESVPNPDYVQPHSMVYPPRLPWENPPMIKSETHGYCGLGGQP